MGSELKVKRLMDEIDNMERDLLDRAHYVETSVYHGNGQDGGDGDNSTSNKRAKLDDNWHWDSQKESKQDGTTSHGSSSGSGEDSKAISSMTNNSSVESNSNSDGRDSSDKDSSNQDSSSESGGNEADNEISETKDPAGEGAENSSGDGPVDAGGPSGASQQETSESEVAHLLTSRMSDTDSNAGSNAALAKRSRHGSSRRRRRRRSSERSTSKDSSGVDEHKSGSNASAGRESSLSSTPSAFPAVAFNNNALVQHDMTFGLQRTNLAQRTHQALTVQRAPVSSAAQELITRHQQQQQLLREQQQRELMDLLRAERVSDTTPSTSSGGQSQAYSSSSQKNLPSSEQPPSSDAPTIASSGSSQASTTKHRPVSVPEDKNTLTDYQILVRQNIEFFEADPKDVGNPRPGRKVTLVAGQVGIRCIHCRNVNSKRPAAATSYFPTKLHRLYHSAQAIAVTHLARTCPNINSQVRETLLFLQDVRQKATVGREYWSMSANAVGVVETEKEGLRFR